MKAPPLRTWIIGNPVFGLAVVGGGGWLLFHWWQAGGAMLIPLVLYAAAVGMVARASGWIAQYRSWKRAWNGMAEPAPQHPRAGWRRKAGLIVLGLSVAFFLADPNNPAAQDIMRWIALLGLLWLAGMLLRNGAAVLSGRSKPSATDAETVTICARPLLPVPSLTDAYSALPPHCRDVLRR